jgi:uncharacterized membrane protein YwaF
MAVVFGINQLIGSITCSWRTNQPLRPLDALPEWPVYILYMEALGVVMYLLLYLPFAVKDSWQKKLIKIPRPSGSE